MGADAALWQVTGWLDSNRIGFRLLADSAGEEGGEGFVDKDTFDETLKDWLENHRDDDPKATRELLAWVDNLPWLDVDPPYLRVFIWW